MCGENVSHRSVLLKEVIEKMNPQPGGRYIDGTLGAGGHTLGLLTQCNKIDVLGIDRDQEALEAARLRLKLFEAQSRLVQGNFSEMTDFCTDVGWHDVDGILLDLGVSSMQLDRGYRGFSYRFEGPLDMRMDHRYRTTASMLLNNSTQKELINIFRNYGEEPRARRITEAIIERRKKRCWETTTEFAELVARVAPSRNGRRQAEGRCFQALRIAVNDELGELRRSLAAGFSLLKKGGRFTIITFHSLEDRIVKRFFLEKEKLCICPVDFPVCRCDKKKELKILTRKPIIASKEELLTNKRSGSAKLRVAEKC